MKKTGIMKFILILLTGLVLGALSFFLLTNFYIGPGENKITETTIKQKLESCSDLVTTRYHYTNVGKFENSLEINGWSIPFTGKSFLLTYSGEALLGCDMEKAEVNIDSQSHTAVITLPEIQILANTIDENSFEIYDEKTNVFNPTRVSDYQAFMTDQKDKIANEIATNGGMEQAKEDATKAVTQLMNLMNTDLKIEVKFEK